MPDDSAMSAQFAHDVQPYAPSDRALRVVAVFTLAVIVASTVLAVGMVMGQYLILNKQRQEIAYSRQVIDSILSLEGQIRSGANAVYLYSLNPVYQGFVTRYAEMKNQIPVRLSQLRSLATKPEDVATERRMQEQMNALMILLDKQMAAVQTAGHALPINDPSKDPAGKLVVAISATLDDWRRHHSEAIVRGNQEADVQLRQTANRVVTAAVGVAVLLALLSTVALRLLRRRAQLSRELRKWSELWHGTLAGMNQGVAVHTLDGRCVYWNQRFAEIHGVPADQMYVGITVEEIIRRSVGLTNMTTDEAVAAAMRTCEIARQGGSAEFESHDNKNCDLHTVVRPMGRGYFSVTLTDITMLKRSEYAAIEQSQRLAAIMDNVPDAIITLNPSGSIESWSAGAERMFGYKQEQIRSRNVAVLWPESVRGDYEKSLQRMVFKSDQVKRGQRREFSAMRADGGVFPIDLVVSEMHIGERQLFVGIVRDITERRAVEQLKSEFIATVSHELRTPLTSIAGSLALLAQNSNNEFSAKTLRLVNIAHKNSERLTRLINDILDLERSESGRMSLNRKPMSLQSAIEHAVEAMRAYAAQFNVTYVVRGSDGGHKVFADSDRIMQVLANLMSNAVKFSPLNSQVEITVASRGKYVRVAIRDHGPGIPMEFQPRIFSRFAQADGSDTRQKEGSGLGLAISKSLVELHQGFIGFETAANGTTFWFELPSLPEASIPRDILSQPLLNARILVCEDDPDAAQFLHAMLEDHGCTVQVAGTAGEARKAIAQTRFEVLLIDINLPDEDGLSLIASLRSEERSCDLPIIVVSAIERDDADAPVVTVLKIDDWISKPVDLHRLHLSIQRLLPARDKKPRVLHVEDDESICTLVSMALSPEVDIVTANTLAKARELLSSQTYDLIVLDIRLPDGSGIELLSELRVSSSHMPVVLFSAQQPSHEITGMVQAALVKTQNSLESLLESVRHLVRRDSTARQDSPD
jgi:PAS domain S-box-containing protein